MLFAQIGGIETAGIVKRVIKLRIIEEKTFECGCNAVY